MNSIRREEGQAIFLAAGLLGLFLAIAVVVLDIGYWLHDKRDAQNDVDAAVLAGAQELPDEGAAQLAAEQWAAANKAGDDLITPCELVDMTGNAEADLIRCTVERERRSLENGLLAIDFVTIRAKAAAAKMKAVAACVTPWAVTGDPNDGPLQGGHWGLISCEEDPACKPYIFHTSDFVTPGNFGALALYGNGATDYKEAIEAPCGSGTEGACDSPDPEVCVGCTLECEVKTGNLGQNTDDALTQRDANFGAGPFCDVTTYNEAWWLIQSSTTCAAARAVLIPIIVEWPPQGHSGPVQILGLATFYIASWDREPPYGNVDVDGDTIQDDAMVWGYFVEDVPVIPAWDIQWGYSDDPFAPIMISLVE